MSEAPKDLKTNGKRLWTSVMKDFELDVHEELLLLQACRCLDRLDALHKESVGKPLTKQNRFGEEVANPYLVESRNQQITYARLLSALRLPEDNAAGRPQRRGIRGVYSKPQAV